MAEATGVFITGMVGVFLGMGLLYVTILVNAAIADRVESWRAKPDA